MLLDLSSKIYLRVDMSSRKETVFFRLALNLETVVDVSVSSPKSEPDCFVVDREVRRDCMYISICSFERWGFSKALRWVLKKPQSFDWSACSNVRNSSMPMVTSITTFLHFFLDMIVVSRLERENLQASLYELSEGQTLRICTCGEACCLEMNITLSPDMKYTDWSQ